MTHQREDQAKIPDVMQWIDHILKSAHNKAVSTPLESQTLITTYIGTLLEKQLKGNPEEKRQLFESLRLTQSHEGTSHTLREIAQDFQSYIESIINKSEAHTTKYPWNILTKET